MKDFHNYSPLVFFNIKLQLSDNVVTNLQYQIDQNREAIERHEERLAELDDLQITTNTYTSIINTSGTWSNPFADPLKVDVLCIGGGGGGGNGTNRFGGGGGGGHMVRRTITLAGRETVNVNIGSGGEENSNGGTTSFGTYLSANGGSCGSATDGTGGSGGSGGGGGTRLETINYGDQTYGSGAGGSGGSGSYGGGGGGGSTGNFMGFGAPNNVKIDKRQGGKGGNGGTYGGGGGGSGSAAYWGNYYSGYTVAISGASGGSGGTYGGTGGSSGSIPTQTASNGYISTPSDSIAARKGTDTSGTAEEFKGTGAAGSAKLKGTAKGSSPSGCSLSAAGAGGGGYGGIGGNAADITDVTTYVYGLIGGGAGGGGGYGGNGGNGGKSSVSSNISSWHLGGGGGGGGYGGNGGNGGNVDGSTTSSGKPGQGYGAGGGGSLGGGGGGYGKTPYSNTNKSGNSGVCIVHYTKKEISLTP